ncbi:MAG TPA: hypothetical protein DCS63_01585 [Elusimicrobia bacterium]|nr:hypothetical protein [Elusimicrobiota bacterium]
MLKGIFSVSILISGFVCLSEADDGALGVSTETRTQYEITDSTEPSVFPKLLWEKKLSKPITSSAISKDGTKIAIADETGYLTVYNTKGGKLWTYRYIGKLPGRTYEFKSEKSDTALLNIQFSSSGKHIVCDLGVMNTWDSLEGFDNFERYEPYKKLCFDSEGKLLWQNSKKGDHVIGGDTYVLIKPRISDDSCGEGDCDPYAAAPVTYYLLNMKGQTVFTGKTGGQNAATYGFSGDGEYVFVHNKLVKSADGSIVWVSRGQFEEIYGNLIIQAGKVCDIVTRKEFSRINAYKVSLTSNYVAGMVWDLGIITVTVYEIKNGHIVWTRQYKNKEILGKDILFYLTKDEKHFLLGSETGMLFYDISGQKIGELKITPKVVWPQYFGYSISKNGEYVLLGHEKTIKLYMPF